MRTKEILIEKILSIDDPKILEEINQWINSFVEVASAEKYTGKELNAVREGYNQYKLGDTFTQQEANRIFDKWLKEK
jgi:hypothetical protein